jgi:hypothetical protein
LVTVLGIRGRYRDFAGCSAAHEVEADEGHQVTGTRGEVIEADRSLERVVGQQTGYRRGQLGERTYVVTSLAETVRLQHLLHIAARDHEPSSRKYLGVTPRAHSFVVALLRLPDLVALTAVAGAFSDRRPVDPPNVSTGAAG